MAKKRKKSRKSCYCSISRDSRGVRDMVCSRSKTHTRRVASKIGRKTGHRYGKVFRAAISNC